MKPNSSTRPTGRFPLLANGLSKIGKGVLLLFILSMAVIISISSIQHFFPYTKPSTFLQSKQAQYSIYLPALYGHILTSGLILFLGFLGFSQWIQAQYVHWHRRFGKVYVGLVLLISAPSALVMAIYAHGGWSIKSCFVFLSILWWFFTWQAWNSIRQKDIPSHRAFMLRSYALTLSAITLRWYSFFLGYFFSWYNLDSYVWVAWLSWVPNLVIVEIWIRKNRLSFS